MIRDVFHILFYKILIFLKVNTPFNSSTVLKNAGSGFVYGVFAYGCYLLSQNTIEYLLVQVKIGDFLLHRFMLVVLFIFFIAINVGNIVVSFSTLYKSKEVFHLITKPISFSKIFLIKFLDNFFYSSTTLLLIITAVMIGYGNYYNYSILEYPLILLFLILPFMFTAGSAGVIILLIILLLAGKWGIKKVLSVIGLIYGAGIVAFYFVSNPLNLVQKIFDYYPNINLYFGFLENGLVRFLPNYWVSESLYWISAHKVERALPYIYLNILVSITIFLIALFIADRWFYRTWLTSLKIQSELKNGKKNKNLLFGFERDSRLNTVNETILKREFWLFFREPNQWIHLMVMIFLIIVFVSSVSGIDIVILESYNLYLKTIIYLVVSLFNIFLVASLSLRFIFPLISLEGEALWKIRSSPLDFNQLLNKRLAVYFLVIFLIGQLITFFSNFQFPFELAITAQVNTAIASVTLVCLNFGMGGIFANYREKNAIRLASSQGASITFLFTILYLAIFIVVLFIPVSNFFFSLENRLLTSKSALLISSLVLFILGIIVSLITYKTGLKSFAKDI